LWPKGIATEPPIPGSAINTKTGERKDKMSYPSMAIAIIELVTAICYLIAAICAI